MMEVTYNGDDVGGGIDKTRIHAKTNSAMSSELAK